MQTSANFKSMTLIFNIMLVIWHKLKLNVNKPNVISLWLPSLHISYDKSHIAKYIQCVTETKQYV